MRCARTTDSSRVTSAVAMTVLGSRSRCSGARCTAVPDGSRVNAHRPASLLEQCTRSSLNRQIRQAVSTVICAKRRSSPIPDPFFHLR